MDIERLKQLFDLDVATGTLRWRVARRSVKAGDVAGAKRLDGYAHVCIDGQFFQSHRVVFAISNGYWPEQVDHANGIRDDNRPVNLREATASKNRCNAARPRNNTSGVKGVYWCKQIGKWKARVGFARKTYYVGVFDDIADAADAIDAMRKSIHGDFANKG